MERCTVPRTEARGIHHLNELVEPQGPRVRVERRAARRAPRCSGSGSGGGARRRSGSGARGGCERWLGRRGSLGEQEQDVACLTRAVEPPCELVEFCSARRRMGVGVELARPAPECDTDLVVAGPAGDSQDRPGLVQGHPASLR